VGGALSRTWVDAYFTAPYLSLPAQRMQCKVKKRAK
jgi:hypothetical protein